MTPERSTIWKKLDRFDTDRDGRLGLRETYNVFRTIGFSATWSWVSALATALYRGPASSGRLTFTIDLAGIEKSIIKGQTGAWDAAANPIPARVEEFLAAVDPDRNGRVTLEALRSRVTADAKASLVTHPPRVRLLSALTRKRRFGESFSAWVQLMEVAGHVDRHGVRYLTPDQVRAVFDGTVFDVILSQPAGPRRITGARVVKEMLGGMWRA